MEHEDWINHIHNDLINQHTHNAYHEFDTHFTTQSSTLFTYNIIKLNNSTSTSNIYFPNNYLLYFVLIRNLMNII